MHVVTSLASITFGEAVLLSVDGKEYSVSDDLFTQKEDSCAPIKLLLGFVVMHHILLVRLSIYSKTYLVFI